MRTTLFVVAALVAFWGAYLVRRVASPATANAQPAPSASDVKTTSPDEIRQSYLNTERPAHVDEHEFAHDSILKRSVRTNCESLKAQL